MKKKLSRYWWCQICGWGIYLLMGTFFYFRIPRFANFQSYFSVINVTLAGLLTSHLMRMFIIKTGILNQRVWKQLSFIVFTTGTFAFIYLLFYWLVEFFRAPNDFKPEYSLLKDVFIGIMINSQYLGVWNLLYFIYHYIEKSRHEQVERVRLESELKIRQLESEKAQIEFQRNLADISLTALRFQMNPHFIFNCLNSIKLYTMQNNTEAASVYLTKFSKLIRLVMENSSREKILLSSELDMLRLYIEMEAMRFKEKLQYNIHIKEEVETDYTELPPLLLQPYVENAIWHGLMPKDEGGRIDIHVAMSNDDSLLEIDITDNGIGREKSKEAGRKDTTRHTPYGMKVTSERIALINQTFKTGADVTIHDLKDESGNPSGTKVMIKIPV